MRRADTPPVENHVAAQRFDMEGDALRFDPTGGRASVIRHFTVLLDFGAKIKQ